MPIILAILALCILRYLEVWRFASLSWWWIVALMAAAFIWFEFVEPMLGLDRRKAHDVDAQRRRERVDSRFGATKKR
jgi:small Trp-rich protein